MLKQVPRVLVFSTFCLSLIVSLPSPLVAQLPAPRLDWVYPVGGTVGGEIEVTIGGGDLDDSTALLFSHSGIVASPKMTAAEEFVASKPVPNTFVVNVAPSVPPGTYEARVVGRFGISNPRRFVVGSLPSQVESGSNKSLDTAQTIALNSVVDGRGEANTRDYYKLNLNAGQRITIEAATSVVGSRMSATLEVLNLDGKELLKSRGIDGFPSAITFAVPEDGVYVVAIYDFLFRGSAEYFYRLKVHEGPHIDWLEPIAVNRASSQVRIMGRNLGEAAKPSGTMVDAGEIQAVSVEVDPNSLPKEDSQWLLPLAAYPLETVRMTTTVSGSGEVEALTASAPLIVTDLPVVSEQNSQDREATQNVEVPCLISGSFSISQDVDRYEFDAKAGQVFWVELFAHRLGMPVDGFIVCEQVISKDDGTVEYKKLHDVDDPGNRNASVGTDFDLSTDDPSFRFQVPGDGRYRLVLTDQFGGSRADPRVRYALRIRTEQPSVEVIAEPAKGRAGNANQAVVGTVAIRRGGIRKLDVQVNRIDGFAGPIQLRVEGLPEFVQCAGQELASNQNRAVLFLQAKEDASAWHGPIRVVATYELNGQSIETSARVGTLVWGTGDRNQSIPISRMTREMMVSVVDCEPEPIQVTHTTAEALRTSRGVAAFEIPVNLTRRLEFNAAYATNATGLPGEIKPAGPVQFAENGNEAKLVLNLANGNVRPGSYRIWLQGDLTYKQARNPQAITQAQERQKQVEAWTAEWQAKKESANALLAEEPAKIAAADQKVVEAQAVVRTQDQSLTATAETLAKTGASLRSKRDELAAAPENQALAVEVKQLGEAFDQQASAVQASMTKRQQAKESLIAVQAERAALDQQIAEAKQVLSEVDAKLTRLAELKKQADAQLDAANKANQPVDRTYAAISLPIDFEVVATPLALDSSNAEANAGEATQLPAKIGRQFGFSDAVQVAATLPNGVPGLAVAAGTINADQTEVQLGVTTTAETPPGEYPVTLKATAKFNNVDVEATTTVMIKINPAA